MSSTTVISASRTTFKGTDIRDFLGITGNKAGRGALFGIPLQQQWSYRVDGDNAPTYYMSTDAHLYYYSFTDAWLMAEPVIGLSLKLHHTPAAAK